MRNKHLILLLILLFVLSACNMPGKYSVISEENEDLFLWNLGAMTGPAQIQDGLNLSSSENPAVTATPQLIGNVDFEQAFAVSMPVSPGEPVFQASGSAGTDTALWLFFDPAEYSAGPIGTLYAAFQNTGESVWKENYALDFFAGKNPSAKDKIFLNTQVLPGEKGTFEIPIDSTDSSWKACWHLNNSEEIPIYEFCYNLGDGTNSGSSPAPNQGEGPVDDGVFYAFRFTEGNPPGRHSDAELAASFVSTSPSNKHTFCAYDHSETFTVNFRNDGSRTWDGSYSLVFYRGYNWMHTNAAALNGSVSPGETASFSMSMEIFEDNDTWVSCWYLASPEGYNLGDFCFDYYTRSCK